MGVINTRVDNCDNDVAIAPGRIAVVFKPLPCFLGAGATECPLLWHTRVIRCHHG